MTAQQDIPAELLGQVSTHGAVHCHPRARLPQGIPTNSEEEIDRLSDEDVSALATLLGDKPYFLGDTPSAADAAVFGASHP